MSVGTSEFNTLNLTAVAKVENEVEPEGTRNVTGNEYNSLLSARSGGVKIKVEKVDAEDILTAAECTSHHADSSYALESNVIIKKEEDLGMEEEVEDILVDNHPGDFVNKLEISSDEKFQATVCDETNESSVWGLCQESCRDTASDLEAAFCESRKFRPHFKFFTDEKCVSGIFPSKCQDSSSGNIRLVNINSLIKSDAVSHGQLQNSSIFYDSAIKLKEMRVVLEDLSPENVQKKKGSKSCRCMFCTGKYKPRKPGDIRTHVYDEPFSCTYCPATFKLSQSLRLHLRSHTKYKPVSCPLCPRKFSHTCRLKLHLNHHSDEKPFSCTHCGARFKGSRGLAGHLMSHSGEKRFSCTVCSAKFCRKHVMEKHMNSHMRGNSFACPSCIAKYKLLSAFKDHLQKSDVCLAKFNKKFNVEAHTDGEPLPNTENSAPLEVSAFETNLMPNDNWIDLCNDDL